MRLAPLRWQRRRLLAAATAVCASAAAPGFAQSPQVLTLTRVTKGQEVTRIEEALRLAYSKLNVELQFVEQPPERALVESNEGRADGETARIGGIGSNYINLRRVDVPIHTNTISVFVRAGDNPPPATLAALSTLSRVGISIGTKSTEDATAGWSNVVRVASSAQGLQMLKAGRLDAFLGRTESFQEAIRRADLDPADFQSRELMRYPIFHYLNKKHVGLLPAVTRELLRIKGSKATVLEALYPNG